MTKKNTRAVSTANALKMAIETLEECLDDLQGWAAYASDYFQDKHDLPANIEHHQNIINACKEALESQEQEPVAWRWIGLHYSFAYETENPFKNDSIEHQRKFEVTPLYTHPCKNCHK